MLLIKFGDCFTFRGTDLGEYLDEAMTCYQIGEVERINPRPLPAINYKNSHPYVRINSFIDDVDIKNIETLINCVKIHNPKHFEDRIHDRPNSGGHNMTFVGGFVQIIMPEVFEHMISTISVGADTVGWRPHPRHLGIRGFENLVYISGPRKMTYHRDDDSIYTTVIMLSDGGFGGGSLFLRANNPSEAMGNIGVTYECMPTRGSAVMFDSLSPHGVDVLTSGVRSVLVFEMWIYESPAPDQMRPPASRFKHLVQQPYFLTTNPHVGTFQPFSEAMSPKRPASLLDLMNVWLKSDALQVVLGAGAVLLGVGIEIVINSA